MIAPAPGSLGVEILDPLVSILEGLGAGAAVVFGLLLGIRSGEAAVALVRRTLRLVRSRRASRPVAASLEWPGDWLLSLTLLVRVDEGEGVLRPSVQILGSSGGPSGGRGRIRLELVDHGGELRLTVKRDFPPDAINTELPLPHFAPPPGASIDDVLRWRWDVVLSGGRSERRWREWPQPLGGLNPEGELLEPAL